MEAKTLWFVPILILVLLAIVGGQLLTPVRAETDATEPELYPDPYLFDPNKFYTIREAEGEGPGFWVDHPSVFFDKEAGVFWLAYRWRKPLPDRGHTIVIANSTDGINFKDVWSASKYEFPSPRLSITGVFILKDPKTGMFKLYISKALPNQIFKLDDVKDPADFDPATTHLVLGRGAKGEWDEFHVVMPWVRWIEDRYIMLYRGVGTVDDVETERLGSAMSFDGETWEKNPNNPILDGGPGRWDPGIRWGAIWQYPDHWLVVYTGHIGWYRERDQGIGLAEWRLPLTWPYPKLTKLTVDEPFATGIDHPIYKTLMHLDCVPVLFPNGTRRAYFYYSTGTEDGSMDLRVSVQKWIDWWPMFRHDPRHTGYSTSTAPNTNNTAWTYKTDGHVHSSPAVVDGVVYVGSDDHYVYALNATSGTLIWRYYTGGEVQSGPAVVDGKVYVGSWDRNVYALNATTGALVWSYRTSGWVRSCPLVADGRVYVSSWDGNVYALDAATGALIWSYTTASGPSGSGVVSSPAVSGGVVYVGSEGGNVYALNASTGALIWSYHTGYHAVPSPAVVDGVVYGGTHGRFFALNASTGALIWRYYVRLCFHSSPAVSGGVVYVGSLNYNVYALNASTGALIWSYYTGAPVQSSPAVADGKVFVGSADHNVYALDAATGALLWSYTTGDKVISSPAVAGGVVYVGSYDGKIYAFGLIDKTPPVTEISLSGTVGLEGWYVSDVVVNLTATDDVSGVAKTEYSFDNTTWITYTGTFTISTEGTTLVYYKSTDNLGNIEETKSQTVKIDKTPPVTTDSLSGTFSNGWYTSDVTITLDAFDATAGVENIYYKVDSGVEQIYSAPFLVSGGGPHVIEFWSTENAGNVETGHTDTFQIDTIAPVTSASLNPSTPNGLNGWYVSGVTVTLTPTDDFSGVAITEYSFDGVSWNQYTGPFAVSFEGTTTVYYYSTDNAGNAEDTKTETLKIDMTSAETLATLNPETSNGQNDWYTVPVEVTLTGSDETSGVTVTHYRINDGLQQVYTTPFTVSDDGMYTICFWSVDDAGNIETAKSVSFRIDQASPATLLARGDPNYGADPTYVSSTTDFALEATDAVSGVDCIEYKIDSGVWTPYLAPFNVLDFGSRTLYYRSIDMAGNEDTQSVWIVVNATSISYSGDTTGQYSDPVTVEATLIDMATQQSISDKSIIFTVGSQSATSVTNSQGIAVASIVLDQPAGEYTVSATFSDDGDYLGSSDSQLFTILKEDATVEYTGDTVVSTTTKTINLRATVFDSPDSWWGDLTKMQVTFRIYTVPIDLSDPVAVVGPVSVAQTDMQGVGVAVIEIPNLPENGYIIIVSIDGDDNNYYRGPTSDPIPLTVYEPTGEFVTGGGWIWDPSGGKGNFGFNVKYTKSGKPQGHSVYVYRDGEWDYIVKSNAWIGLAIEEGHAYFEAKCVVQKYNPATGELVWAGGNYKFRVDVWDNDSDGGVDVYQIRVLDKNGVLFHEAGFDPLGELQGGNIVIHDKRKKKP